MKLRELRISNFKSIYDLEIKLGNLTIFIGRNNSGKTAILEAIQLLFNVLGSVKGSINLSQVPNLPNSDIKDQIRALWFYNDWERPIEIRAVIEFDVELSSNEIKKVIEEECGFKEGLQGLDCTITIRYKNKDNKVELAVKELNVLGCVTRLKKEILKSSKKEKLTPCKIVKDYKILNTNAMESIRRILEGKIRIIIPAASFAKKLGFLGFLTYILRTPVISETLIENIKDAKSNHRYQNLFFRLTQKVEGTELFFERPQERDVLSKIYNYGTGYTSFPFTSYGSGSQTVDAIIASIITAEPGSIVLIEEPETHQHPTFVKRMARVIESLSKELNLQIILTTHSPIFVSAIRSKENIVTVHKEYVNTSLGKVPASQITKAGEGIFKHLDIMVSELGVPTSVPFFADVAILVEGGSDKIILEHMIEILSEKNKLHYLPILHYEVIPFAQMPGSIKAWIKMLMKYGIKTFVIVDGDEEGRRYKEKAEKQGLKYGESIFVLSKEDILCYIPSKDLSKLMKEVLNKHFNTEDRLRNINMDILNRLNELYKKIESGKSCKEVINYIASIIFDNVLNEDEKESYKNNKDLLKEDIKMKVAKEAIYRGVFKNVPRDIMIVLQDIDGRIGVAL